MELFVLIFLIAAFIGLVFAIPIAIRPLRRAMRQKPFLRLGLIFVLSLLSLLTPMALYIDTSNGLYFFYWCNDRKYNQSEETVGMSYCDDAEVFNSYRRELLLQMMIPPPLRNEEVCWTVEAGTFCTPLSRNDWGNYFILLGIGSISAIVCGAILWRFSRDERKMKESGI